MLARIVMIQLSNPRKVALLLSLSLLILNLVGCNVVPACPSGGSGGSGCVGE